MKRFVFLSKLQRYFESRQTARCASARIRSVLISDRDTVRNGATKKLSAELAEVLARYFTVTDFRFFVEDGAECMHYTLEAEFAKM